MYNIILKIIQLITAEWFGPRYTLETISLSSGIGLGIFD